MLWYNTCMFTGIVEEIGLIKYISEDSIFVLCDKILEDINIGDSIAVDGVCLTVTQFDANGFWADVSYETRKVTKLFNLKCEDKVNLERAMTLASRFGGHIISGHVDCVGKINSINKNNGFYELAINLQTKEFSKYFVKKGSIAIDGISLTIADCTNDTISIAVIPHTYENTIMSTYKENDSINIEFDILAKYVEKNLLMNDNKSNITEDFLKANGFV